MLTHKGTIVLKTSRLILRRFTINDSQTVYDNWATDEKVTKFLAWDVHASVDATRETLSKWVSKYESPEYYHWAIEYENTLVGAINLHAISNKSWQSEMGYNLGSKWWDKGIMTEAASEVVAFAFNEIGMNKICALYDTENVGSGRVLQKIGMVCEGHFKKHSRRKDGIWGNVAFYSITHCN